jgi:exportin-T
MESLSKAISTALDPLAEATIKAQALQYCSTIKQSADGYRICISLFKDG